MMLRLNIGILILRLTLGLLILFHGVHKLIYGVGGIANLLAAHHLPGVLAYGAYIGEVIAPLLVLTGIYSRLGAGLIVVNMLVAFALVHIPHGQFFQLTDQGGWQLELQAFYLLAALALVFAGPGNIRVLPAKTQA